MRFASRSTGVCLLALSVFACGGSDGTGPNPPAVPTAEVAVVNLAFRSGKNATQNPAVDTIPAGSRVRWTWTNTEGATHNIHPVAGGPTFLGSADLTGSGTKFIATFANPGTYLYECTYHAAMTGRIVVQ